VNDNCCLATGIHLAPRSNGEQHSFIHSGSGHTKLTVAFFFPSLLPTPRRCTSNYPRRIQGMYAVYYILFFLLSTQRHPFISITSPPFPTYNVIDSRLNRRSLDSCSLLSHNWEPSSYLLDRPCSVRSVFRFLLNK
jgi:hypothetical protein